MKKIGELLSKNFGDIKENFLIYKLSYMWTFIVTLALTITYENEFILSRTYDDLWVKIVYFYAASGVIVWLSEVIFKKLWQHIAGCVVSIIAGVFFTYNAYVKQSSFWLWVLVGYIIIVLSIGVFIHIRKQKVEAEKYLLALFQNVFNVDILFIIVMIGLHLIVGIFTLLIFEADSMYIYERLWTILIGAIYIPGMIYSVTKKKLHISLFIKNLVKYVLYPLTMLAIVVLYIYIGKIIVLSQMPSNEVYSIIACLFTLGYMIILMVKNYVDENKFYKVSTLCFSIAFLPLIVVQIISLNIRCSDYGITYSRYVGIMFIVFEIVVIVLSLINKKALLEYSLIVLVVLTFITTMSPFNMVNVTFSSQIERITAEWKVDKKYSDLKVKNKSHIQDIYSHLHSLDAKKAKKDMLRFYSKKDIKLLEEDIEIPFMTKDDKYMYVDYISKDKSLDIEKYDKIYCINGQYEVHFYGNDDTKENKELDEDMLRALNNLFNESGKNIESVLKKDNKVKLTDKRDMLILKMHGSYYEEVGVKLEDFEYQFVILEK